MTMAVTMYRKSRLVEGGVAVSSSLLLLVFLLPCLLFQSVSALPTFVPNCTLAGPHTERNPEGDGELADGEFVVIVGGEMLEVDEPIELEAGITYSISLESIGEGPGAIPFRGHLLRLNGGDEGISTVNSFLVSDPSSQIAGSCILQDQIGGLSHADSDEKTQAGGQIRMLDPDTNVVLEVWVVVRNCGPESPLAPAPNNVESCDPAESTYYNSQYTLNFVAAQQAESLSPSSTPTELTTSSIPSISPSQMPSAAPSVAPSTTEPTTMMPSDMPSASPTVSPSTELPTSSTNVTLSDAPSTAALTNSTSESLAPTASPAPSITATPTINATASPVSVPTPAAVTPTPPPATPTGGTKSPVATPAPTALLTSAAARTCWWSMVATAAAFFSTAVFVGL